MECLYRVAWSRNGRLQDRQESEPLASLEYARSLADKYRNKSRCVTILRADLVGENAGKYFLYQIVK
jgi:hypothetical protein